MPSPQQLFSSPAPQKNIAWVENAEIMGGAELFSIDMLSSIDTHLASRPLKIDVLTSGSSHLFSKNLATISKTLAEDVHITHNDIYLPPLKPLSFGTISNAISSIRRIASFIRRNNYDIVYTNTVRGAIVVGIAQYMFPQKTKTICMIHDYTMPAFLIRWILPRFDQVLACSYLVKQYLVENGIKAWQAEVVENGIDTQKYSSIAPVQPPLFTVGVIGRIAEWKGQMTVLLAAKWLKENAKDYPFSFIFFGEPSHKQEDQEYYMQLQDFAAYHSLNVIFAGFTPIESALEQSKIVVSPSIGKEPFGRVPIEAAASMRVLCVSDSGTPAHIFEDKKNAFFFPAGDSQELAKTLVIIAHNMDKSLEIASRGQSLVQEKFSLESITARFWGFFQ